MNLEPPFSVFTNRDVDVGEEITISYLDHTKPRPMRQVDMRKIRKEPAREGSGM
jgi:hypothetical protein